MKIKWKRLKRMESSSPLHQGVMAAPKEAVRLAVFVSIIMARSVRLVSRQVFAWTFAMTAL